MAVWMYTAQSSRLLWLYNKNHIWHCWAKVTKEILFCWGRSCSHQTRKYLNLYKDRSMNSWCQTPHYKSSPSLYCSTRWPGLWSSVYNISERWTSSLFHSQKYILDSLVFLWITEKRGQRFVGLNEMYFTKILTFVADKGQQQTTVKVW